MTADWFVRALIAQYVIAATAYGFQGDWPKMAYWIGATIIGGSVLAMK